MPHPFGGEAVEHRKVSIENRVVFHVYLRRGAWVSRPTASMMKRLSWRKPEPVAGSTGAVKV